MAYDGPAHVISGYRSPKTNAMLARRSSGVAKNSYHTKGMAIDLRLPGRRLEDVRAAALSLGGGGVGFTPGRSSCTSTRVPSAPGKAAAGRRAGSQQPLSEQL